MCQPPYGTVLNHAPGFTSSTLTEPGTFIVIRPYGNTNIFGVNVGRDVCVLAGNVVSVGTFHMNLPLWALAINVGNCYAVLAGTLTYTGGAIVNIAGAQVQFGAGKQIFAGRWEGALWRTESTREPFSSSGKDFLPLTSLQVAGSS